MTNSSQIISILLHVSLVASSHKYRNTYIGAITCSSSREYKQCHSIWLSRDSQTHKLSNVSGFWGSPVRPAHNYSMSILSGNSILINDDTYNWFLQIKRRRWFLGIAYFFSPREMNNMLDLLRKNQPRVLAETLSVHFASWFVIIVNSNKSQLSHRNDVSTAIRTGDSTETPNN